MGGRQVHNVQITAKSTISYLPVMIMPMVQMFSQARHIPNCDNKVAEIAYGTKVNVSSVVTALPIETAKKYGAQHGKKVSDATKTNGTT